MLFVQEGWIAFLCLLAGIVADRLLGEPKRWHPLVGFGRLAAWVERRLNRDPRRPSAIARGAAAWLILVIPPAGAAHLLCRGDFAPAVHALLLTFALGANSLKAHIEPIEHALRAGDLAAARALTQRVVSRDLSAADSEAVTRAALESTLENGGDAIFSTLFWFLIAGGPGVLLHRLANTLDAIWGYRCARYLRFGRTAARLDDLLNYLPARLTALTYTVLGHRTGAWRCWRAQACRWDSPNAGPIMAAGAGALQVELGGGAFYHGRWEERPVLGCGRAPQAVDLDRALRLLDRGVVLWLAVALPLTAGGAYA